MPGASKSKKGRRKTPTTLCQTPECPLGRCDGSGFLMVKGELKRCRCQLEKSLATMLGDGLTGLRLQGVLPRTDDQRRLLDALRADPDGSYYIYGRNRTGKTHIAAALFSTNYRQTALRRKGMLWFNDIYLKDAVIRGLRDYGAPAKLNAERIRRGEVCCVFIDDFGKVKVSESVRQEYYAIVNELYLNRASCQLVCTSEHSLKDLMRGGRAEVPFFGRGICRRIYDLCSPQQRNIIRLDEILPTRGGR